MSFLTDKIGLYIAGSLAVVLALALLVTSVQLHSARGDAEKAHKALSVAVGERDSLILLTNRQSASIAALGDVGKSKMDALSAELAPVLKRTASIEAKADKLLNAKIPGKTKCERWDAADEMVKESLQ